MIYNTCKFVFSTTSVLYLITLAFASYVGVYLTYVAVPVIVLSGVLTYWLEPEEDNQPREKNTEERLQEIEKELKELE